MRNNSFISPIQIADEYEKLKKEYNQLEKVYRDTDRDFITQMHKNTELFEENKKLKEEIHKLKNENSELGIKKIKANYEKKIKKMQLALEQMEQKVSLQSKPRQITDKQIREIKDLLNQGVSYRKISDTTNWSINTISKIKNGYYD